MIHYDKKEPEPCRRCADLEAEVERLRAAIRETQRASMPLHNRLAPR